MRVTLPTRTQSKLLPTVRRNAWLATWLQDRRRRRSLAPAPELEAVYPSFIAWTWNYPNPAGWNVYQSFDEGVTFQVEEAGFTATAREYAPADGSLPTFIVGVDENGAEVTRRSRIVVPSDAPYISPFWDGLVAYFNLDEAGEYDDAIDSAGVMGSLAATDSIPLVASAGPGGHDARDFGVGGVYAGYQMFQDNFVALTTFPFTINIWHYQTDNGGQTLLAAGGLNFYGFSLFVATDGGWFAFGLSGDGWSSGTGVVNAAQNPSQWNMFSFVFTETDFWAYLNGTEMSSGTHSGGASFADVDSTFQLSPLPWTCDGPLAMLGMWSRALSAGEVLSLFNSGGGLSYGEL